METKTGNFQPLNCKSGTDYELWVLNLLTINGFNAKRTGKDDNGIDIIAEIDINEQKFTFFIQCKFYNKPVAKAPIQEVYTGSVYYGNSGKPVVITNNIVTADALKYAKSLGVEVICQYEFDELVQIVNEKLTVNDIKKHTGMLGIIIGQYLKDIEYLNNSVNDEYVNVPEIQDRTEEMKEEYLNSYNTANGLIRESEQLQRVAMMKYQQAMEIHKEAMIRHLNYPCSSAVDTLLGGLTMANVFEQLLKSVNSLSPEQFAQLYTAMENRKAQEEQRVKDIQNGEFMPCVHCGSTNTIKHGKVRGKQRFYCKDCEKTFGQSTDTVLVNSKLSKTQWEIILRGMIENQSVYAISKDCGISPSAVWVNRIKICAALMNLYDEQDNFVDIAECDEYYAPTSFKGKRDPKFFIEILERMPRHHWTRDEKIQWLIKNGFYSKLANDPERLEALLKSGDNKKRGISNDQTCVLTCQDRSGHLVMIPVSLGRLETDDVSKALAGKFPTDGIMVTDSHNAYPKFAEQEKIQLEQIEADKHTKGAFNLARINSLHSDLAAYWDEHKENIPATKYMDLSLIFMWWIRKNKELSTIQKIEKLYEIITNPEYKVNMTYERIKNREITLNTKGIIPEEIKRL